MWLFVGGRAGVGGVFAEGLVVGVVLGVAGAADGRLEVEYMMLSMCAMEIRDGGLFNWMIGFGLVRLRCCDMNRIGILYGQIYLSRSGKWEMDSSDTL